MYCTLSFQVSGAESISNELQSTVNPESGLSSEVLSDLGPFDGAVDGFGARLLDLIQNTLARLPDLGLGEALRTLGLVLAGALLCALLEDSPQGGSAVPLVGTLTITAACIRPLGSMLALGTETIRSLHHYMTLLIPGLAGLMAASGGISAAGSASLGLVLFDLLLTLTDRLLVPLLYLFLVLGVAEAGLGLDRLEKLRDFVKWVLVTAVKGLMWAYAAILAGTGLVNASVDGQKLHTLRAAIAGMVPVVGNLVSEASGSLLGAATLLRTGVGIYGMLAVFGLCLGPFFRMALHYLMLRLAAAICGLFGKGSQSPLLERLCQAMGLMAALTGIACLLALMILVLCIGTVTL